MIDALAFQWDSFSGLFIAGSLVLLAIFLYKEWRDGKPKRRVLRVLAAVLAVSSLLCMALRPSILQDMDQRHAVVLSEGFEQNDLDSLKKSHPRLQVHRYAPGKPLEFDPEVTTVSVLGYGLASYDAWMLDSLEVAFYPPGELPSGITRLAPFGPAMLGEDITLRGLYSKPKSGHRLILKDPGGNPLDSILLQPEPSFGFQLTTRPKAPGSLTYSLEEVDSAGQVVRTNPVPIRVRRPKPMRILILNKYPSFETRYLKNFLEKKGNEILLRSQLSQGLFKYEYINTEKRPIYELSSTLLQDFDLVIADAGSYRDLSRTSHSNLEQSILENGTGLFIQPDASYFKTSTGQSYFRFVPDAETQLDADGREDAEERYPYRPRYDFPVEPLRFAGGQTVGVMRPMGRGKIVTTTVKDSYQWVLKGQAEDYAAFWSALIRSTVTDYMAPVSWQALTPLPRKQAPFEFEIRSTLPDIRPLNRQGDNIPLIGDLMVSGLWKGTEYPNSTGWNRLALSGDSLPGFDYFIYGEEDWRAMDYYNTLTANTRRYRNGKPVTEIGQALVLIPRTWFFGVFLLAMGWLWLEPRLMSDF